MPLEYFNVDSDTDDIIKALESGMSLHCVKDLAGHASITTTEIYLHPNNRLKFEQYQKFEKLMMTEIN